LVSSNYLFDNISQNDPQLVYDLVVSQSTDEELLYGLWADNMLYKVGSFNADSDLVELKDLTIKKVIILNDEAPFRHVDFNVFDPNKFETYFASSANPLEQNDKSALYEKLKEMKIYTLHYWDKSKISKYQDLGSEMLPYHISSAMANIIRNQEDQLLCYVSPNNLLHIALKLDGKFHFYNQYECHTKQDYLYYVLLIAENFNLTTGYFPLVVGGDIAEDSPIFELLKNYIRQIRFFESKRYTINNSTYPFHFYLPLIIAKECA